MTNITPSIEWDTAHSDGDILRVHLATVSPHLDILAIPRELLEDISGMSGATCQEMASRIDFRIEAALATAWRQGRQQPICEPGTSIVRNMETMLSADDFE